MDTVEAESSLITLDDFDATKAYSNYHKIMKIGEGKYI